MFKYGLVFILIGLATVAAYWASPRDTSLPPGLYADPAIFDAGTCYQRDRIPVRITLINGYNTAIKIRSAIASCGCTQPQLAHTLLQPGEQTTITLEWAVGNQRGNISQSIFVYYAIPTLHPAALQRKEILMKAQVIPDICYEPVEIMFIRGQKATKEIILKPGYYSSFMIKDIYTNTRDISAYYENSKIELTYHAEIQEYNNELFLYRCCDRYSS
jgi:hypothetical protein